MFYFIATLIETKIMLIKLRSSNFYPIFLLIFLSFIWGSSFILIKKGLLAYSPIQVGTLRIVLASIVLLPIALKNINTTFKQNWKKLMGLGLIANLIPAILFAIAETNLSSSLTGMLNSLTPVFTIIVGVMFFSTKLNLPIAIGLALGLTGSLILSIVNSDGSIGEFNIYALFVVVATILYGLSGNLIKQFVNKFEPITLVSLTMLMVSPLALIALFSTNFIEVSFNHPDAFISFTSIFILGSIGTAYALGLFNRLIHKTSAVFASSVTYLIPIAAVGWGILDNETLFPLHFIGIGIILIGIVLINKYK